MGCVNAGRTSENRDLMLPFSHKALPRGQLRQFAQAGLMPMHELPTPIVSTGGSESILRRAGSLCFTALCLVVLLAASSCSRADRQQASNVQPVPGIPLWRIQKCVESDELWAECLLHIAVEGIRTGKADEVIKRLKLIGAAIDSVQLIEEGVACTEPLLLEEDKAVKKLVQLSKACGADINLTRFIPLEEKHGYISAMIVLIEDYRSRNAKQTPPQRP